MNMDAGVWIALASVAMALINSTSSVLMLWIRARYKWTDQATAVVRENGSNGGRVVQSKEKGPAPS